MHRLVTILRTKALYPFLLPFFFLFHGFIEYRLLINLSDALLVTGQHLLGSLILFLLLRLFYRNRAKAGLATFSMLSIYFFYGSFHDFLKSLFPHAFIVKYTFLLPFFGILIITIVITIKKTKKSLAGVAFYLNTLLLLLILFDCIVLTYNLITYHPPHQQLSIGNGLQLCNTCKKPDIYLIITDEYAGNESLVSIFRFDNSPFLTGLEQRGFHVVKHSFGNYNYTPFAMSAILNFNDNNASRKTIDEITTRQNLIEIERNAWVPFMEQHGYSFYNYSTFDVADQPSKSRYFFGPTGMQFITSQTLSYRWLHDIGFHMAYWKILNKHIIRMVDAPNANNTKLMNLTKEKIKDTVKPKFIYTHLTLPHYPYYYDKNGKPYPLKDKLKDQQTNMAHYIEYLQYCNKVLLQFIDEILQNSSKPPVIILMSDHGFRYFKPGIDKKYQFNNLMAIYMPDKNYKAFTDSISSINFIRIFLNTQFKQQLPLLQDSINYR